MINIDDKVLQHCLVPCRFLGYVEFKDGHKGWWFDSDWIWKCALNHGYIQNIEIVLLS